MAANFTVTPNLVTIVKKEYHIIETQAEDMNKEYYKLSNNPQVRYRLHFAGVDSSTMNTILAHYDAAYGPYDSFSWTTVPSYIESGSSITGNWVKGTLGITNNGMMHWNVELVIEKQV